MSGCAQMDMVGPETSDRVRQDMVKVRHKQLRLNGHRWVGGKWLGPKGPGGSGRQVVVPEWTWLGQRWAIGPEKAWWGVGDKQSGLKGHGWVGGEQLGSRGCSGCQR